MVTPLTRVHFRKSSDVLALLLLDQKYSVQVLIEYPTFFCVFSLLLLYGIEKYLAVIEH